MFSVCADGSVVWYFWCPRDAGLTFDSCIATTSGCVVSKRCLSSSTVLLMPFGGLLFVACVGVCGCGDVRGWSGCCWGGDVWKFVWWGESGRVGCIRSRV